MRLKFLQNIEKGYTNQSVYNTINSITDDKYLLNDSYNKLQIENMTTPSSNSIPHLTVIGKILRSYVGSKDDLAFSFNQTTKPSLFNFSKTSFTNGITKPIFTRPSDLITFDQCCIKTLNPMLSSNDSRLIYEHEKLFKTDYLVYFLTRSNYLNHEIEFYSKQGYLVEDHFNEILLKIEKK